MRFRHGSLRRTALALAIASVATAGHGEDAIEVSGEAVLGAQQVTDPNESSKLQEHRVVPQGLYIERISLSLGRKEWFFEARAFHLTLDDQRVEAEFGKGRTLRGALVHDGTPKWFSNKAVTLYDRDAGGVFVLPDPMQADLQERSSVMPAPPALQVTPVGGALQDYLDAARPVDLRSRRTTTDVVLEWEPAGGFRLEGGYTLERRAGTRPLAISTGFSTGADVVEFAAPLDYSTQTSRLAASFAGKRLDFGAELGFSRFDDRLSTRLEGNDYYSALLVDNPLRLDDAAGDYGTPNNFAGATLLVSAPQDTTATSLSVHAGWRFGSVARLSGSASMGAMDQGESFLPFTLNAALPMSTTIATSPEDPTPVEVPVEVRAGSLWGEGTTSYEGRVDNAAFDLRFHARPSRFADVSVHWRSYDYDNRTPVYAVTDYAVGDTLLSGSARLALPYGWHRESLGVDLRSRVARGLTLDAGAGRERFERSYRAATETEEDFVRLGVTWFSGDFAFVRALWRRGDRQYESFDPSAALASYPEGEPLGNAFPSDLRTLDLANRTRDRFDVAMSFAPAPRFTIGANVHASDVRYGDTRIGRVADRGEGYALDVSYETEKGLVVYADYGKDQGDFDLRSRYRPVAADPSAEGADTALDSAVNQWASRPTDSAETWGGGIRSVIVPEKCFLDLGATVVEGNYSFHFEPAPGASDALGPDGLPIVVEDGTNAGDVSELSDVTERLLHVRGDLRWRLRESLDLGFQYHHERWVREDFARDPMQAWMGGTDPEAGESMYLGSRAPDYTSTWLALYAHVRF